MGGEWTKPFLTVGCGLQGLLGQHTTTDRGYLQRTLQVVMSTCVCVCLHVPVPPGRTQIEGSESVCVWAGVYQRIMGKEFILLVFSLFCFMLKIKNILTIERIDTGLRLILPFFWLHGQKGISYNKYQPHCIHVRHHLD